MALIHDFVHQSAVKDHLVAGDFNTTPDSADYRFFISGTGKSAFVDPIKTYTPFSHPAQQPFWRIDHILPNRAMMNKWMVGSSRVFAPFSPDSMRRVSDHLPVIAQFKTKVR